MSQSYLLEIPTLKVEVTPNGAKITKIEGLVDGTWESLGCLFCAGPIVNRAKDGKIIVNGSPFDLNHPIHPKDALHGVWPWIEHTVVEVRPSAIELQFELRKDAPNFAYPANFRGITRFMLRNDALEVKLVVENLEHGPLPVGLVSHPLFFKNIREDERPQICFRAQAYYPRQGNIPTGERKPILDEFDYSNKQSMRILRDGIDDCFFGWEGKAWVRYPKTGYQWLITDMYGNSRHLQVWSEQANDFFALEPQTAVGNASQFVNLPKSGHVVLRRPGDRFTVLHRYAWQSVI